MQRTPPYRTLRPTIPPRRRWSLRSLLPVVVPLMIAHSARASDDGWGDEGDAWGNEVEIHGFVESATGSRVVRDPVQPDDFVMGEGRFRLEVSHAGDLGSLNFKGDLIADAVTEDVETDIREASVSVRAARWLYITAGRQVLTWGTGDFVFLNDLFPKDFVSFFIGRDNEYLKAPSNSIKLAFYHDWANADLVWTPIFEPDRAITGERLAFFNPLAGSLIGKGADFVPERPSKLLRNGEGHGRLYRRLGSYELALYGYIGFFKQPRAFNLTTRQATYSRLAVYGASGRGPLLGGIANLEGAFYHSLDDESGRNPVVPNSEVRALAGYERELVANLTLGLQYYLEAILHHDRLLSASPMPRFEPPEYRHTATLRLSYRLLRDTLVLSMFGFAAPLDDSVDLHLRPSVSYKASDAIGITLGSNIMFGPNDYAFFGQLEDATSVYGRLRYTF